MVAAVDVLNPRAVSIAAAAKACGVSPNTFKKYVLPNVDTVRIGDRLLVYVVSLDSWLADRACRSKFVIGKNDVSGSSASRSTASASSVPLTAAESAARVARLDAKLRKSTPKR